MINVRVPESLSALKVLPSPHNLLEVGQFPVTVDQGNRVSLFRTVDIHELEVENHVELLVLWQDVRR